MTVQKWAIIDTDGNVTNIVLWNKEEQKDWRPDETSTVVAVSRNSDCQIGGTYKDGVFMQAPQQQLTEDELLTQADSIRTGLMNEASKKISVLQDSVDLGMAIDDEEEQLNIWKKYRVLLNRVDTSTVPDIIWPEKP